MSTIEIGLSEDQRGGLARLLRAVLADTYVLYTKTRKYHWNVEGHHFHDLHLFFESQYEELDKAIDEIAERIRALGLYSPGSLSEFVSSTRLKEDSGGQIPAREMLDNLLADHQEIIRNLRKDLVTANENFGDAGTQDFLTGLIQNHEKMAWMLRSFTR